MVNQKIALVIDDEPEIVEAVKDVLKKELNYLVLPATDPAVAVDLAQNYLFDLLILDLHMPKLDGFQVLDLVRKRQPNVKVMVITGLYDKYKDLLKKVNVDLVVEKPFDPPRFIRDIIRIAGSTEKVSPKISQKVPKARILIVDDESEQCVYLKEFLEMDEPNMYEVEICHSAQEALSLNNEFQPNVIIFDIKMPLMRGDEMLEKIKGDGDNHRPHYYIVISAIANPDMIERMESAGCLYVTKPFRAEELLALVREKCIEAGLY